jgi:hypothetical protein
VESFLEMEDGFGMMFILVRQIQLLSLVKINIYLLVSMPLTCSGE